MCSCVIVPLSAIDFDEFLTMYKRLFILCKSVVSHDVSDITMLSPRKMGEVQTSSKIPALTKKVGLPLWLMHNEIMVIDYSLLETTAAFGP